MSYLEELAMYHKLLVFHEMKNGEVDRARQNTSIVLGIDAIYKDLSSL